MYKEQDIYKDFAQKQNSKDNSFFYPEQVKEGIKDTLKKRFQTLIFAKGMTEPQFYKSLGFSKQYWYQVSHGYWDIPLAIKIKIAQALGVDTRLIWREK